MIEQKYEGGSLMPKTSIDCRIKKYTYFVSKASKYNDEALTYAKKLIKANYNKATDAEIDTLIIMAQLTNNSDLA